MDGWMNGASAIPPLISGSSAEGSLANVEFAPSNTFFSMPFGVVFGDALNART